MHKEIVCSIIIMDKLIFNQLQLLPIIYNQKGKKNMFNKDLQILRIIINKTNVNIFQIII